MEIIIFTIILFGIVTFVVMLLFIASPFAEIILTGNI